jgi:chromate transporter
MPDAAPSLLELLRAWGRIGCTGFGGPPAHISLLRDLCVERRRWLSAAEFEDAVAACNLLPGPASTQLAVYCAWRLRGGLGALVGGLAFIGPGLVAIVALAALFLAGSAPLWVEGAAAGAGAGVAAVALQAGLALVPASRRRACSGLRWAAYAIVGSVAGAALGAWLVVVLLACGLAEIGAARGSVWLVAAVPSGGIGALAWVALKVGALSYGGGFVIVPLMQHDAVERYHWLTDAEFLNAVALGQVTPGPVLHTVAVVGYGAAGIGGAALAAAIAFSPSFAFVLLGGSRFTTLRENRTAQAFLVGAGPAAVGAILGAAVPLARALHEPWQLAFLGAAAFALLVLRRSVPETLVLLGAAGAVLAGTHVVGVS